MTNNFTNEKIIHVKDGKIEYLKFRRLEEFSDKLVCVFAIRGEANLDYEFDKNANYKNLCKSLNLDYKKLVRIENQIHSNFVDKVEDEKDKYTKIDGLITNKKGIILTTREADCTPIAIYDPENNAIANVHSGWKGTLNQIVEVAIQKMQKEYNSNPEKLIAVVFPNIDRDHFEVDDDVKDLFAEKFRVTDRLEDIIRLGREEVYVNDDFLFRRNQKYLIDTNLVNKLTMIHSGMLEDNIIFADIDTVSNAKYINSYRGSKTAKQSKQRNTLLVSLL